MKAIAKTLGTLLFVAAATSVAPADANAAGVEMDAGALPAKTRASLAADIAAARARSPHLFRAVADTIAKADAIDARSRKRGLPFTARFKALGPNALMPMIEALAFDVRLPAGLSESARDAVRVGLLEAIGSIRDDRAVPVLEHVLARSTEPRVVTASAAALSRVGTDGALAILAAASSAAHKAEPGGARDRAILAGLHDCRREGAAKLLAARLDGADDATARVVVRSLGGVANAWAWRATGDQAELAATRSVAAGALMRAFVSRGGEVREAAAKAILVVDAPDMGARVASARRSAGADLRAALDALELRLRENPARLASP